ncbi:SKP1-interacting partner 15 [Cinnamomum micranthum f. kanehirae]|uniref:SKP1-interacting partner 15 n=1 Tax=Cinnamomum micranthum f. kanehirae TaxID=337451 RepID=A0A3S3NQ82_9MAGN|nr:SKP1-interacting partner 15 [Cinnamomum micranthum f. kanehirae]
MEPKRASESALQLVHPSSTLSPILELPFDLLFTIFSLLPLPEIILCRSVCRLFLQALTSLSFLRLRPRVPLLIVPYPPIHYLYHSSSSSSVVLPLFFDPFLNQWVRLPLDFITPFQSTKITLVPVASSSGLLYLWSYPDNTLIVCNPITRRFRVLLTLGCSWSLHKATVIVGSASDGEVIVFHGLSALYYSRTAGRIFTYVPYKCRSPILVSKTLFALCDISQSNRGESRWRIFLCNLPHQFRIRAWERVDKKYEWESLLDSLEQPYLIHGRANEILMVGALKSNTAAASSPFPLCSTFLIIRLDLERLEWKEAGRMPLEMFKCFKDSFMFKAFGGWGWVCFRGNLAPRLAMWSSSSSDWRWVNDGLNTRHCKFVFDAMLTYVP